MASPPRSETWLGLSARSKPLVQAGATLGVGLGGFFDGIVLHQLLQWHHMLSARTDTTDLATLRLNVLADGLFHVATYAFTVVGIVLIVRAWRHPYVSPSSRTLFGSVLMGWGLFNLVEGLVNHHLLELHHVWPDGPASVLVFDVAFLLSGVLLLALGYGIARSHSDAAGNTRSEAA